jgi:hypothetical protein
MKVLITSKVNGVNITTDYTRYVIDQSLTVEDSINVPTLTSFQLANIDNAFNVPHRSSYVQVISEIYGQNGGYIGTGNPGRVLATGFITTEPERTFLGLSNKVGGVNFNGQVYTYNILISSDEWILNVNSVPYIPAFVNQTDTQILASIAQALMPNFFNTTAMASGTLVPYFQYDPSQTWSDIAKTFADANRFHYKAINKTILYQPFGDQPLGISYDDQKQDEGHKAPLTLKTGLITIPPVNDCIVIGDIEPQTNWTNYFIGDGFTSNFQLTHQVFEGTSATLLQDDWTEGSFTQGQWTINDPLGVLHLADGNGNALGALNIVQKGNTGVYSPLVNATYIQAQNGLELGGGINLQHGSFTFNDTAVGGGGIVGALYGTSNFTPGNCLAGFGVSGQANLGTVTVVSVQIVAANTQLVNLKVNGTLPQNIQPGCVFTCSSFGGASFLNGTTQTVVSVTQISSTQWMMVCQGLFVYNSTYGPTADSGSASFSSNLVFVTASGSAGLVIQPIFNGQYVGPQVVTQVNHQYLLQTWVGAGAPTRFTRPYTNLTRTNTYGAQNLAASGTLTWVVTDVFLGNYVIEQQNPLFGLFPASPAPVVTKFSQKGVSLPPFALYCLANCIDLNVSINYTLLSLPPQGYLTVQSLTGASGGNLPWLPSKLSAPIVYQLGFGQSNQTAQISAQGEAFSLSFYTDDIPSVGARIAFQSWSAGQSIARVQDTVAIANEAAASGDSGLRSAIMLNLSPLPRTSDECEAAAAAAILDREYPQFQGTYTVQTIPYKFENLLAPSLYGYPMSGRFLYINSPMRAVTGQNFYTNTVRFQLLELKQEILSVSVDYGPDLHLEKLLPAFLERNQNVLTPTQTVKPPNPITLPQVLNAHLPTLDNAQILYMVDSLTGNYVFVDIGAPPVTGCEVRNVDSGWGQATQGRVGLFTTQQFTLPRTSRDQTWYLRTLNGGIYSRFSKALRVVYPLIPSSPALVANSAQQIVTGFNGDVRDIYGLELRSLAATGISGSVVIQLPPNSSTNPIIPISNYERFAPLPPGFPLPYNPPITSFSQNSGWDVGEGRTILAFYPTTNLTATGANINTNYQLGDLIYNICPSDASFNGFRVVTEVDLQVGTGIEISAWCLDFGLPYPDNIGSGASQIGTTQLINRGSFCVAASGSMSNGVATIVTRTPHGFGAQQLVCMGAVWSVVPVFNAGANASYAQDNSIFCGTWQITSIVDANTFKFNWFNNNTPSITSVANTPLNGIVTGFPPSVLSFAYVIPGAPPGTLLQRPVFAPSDLVIDLTQPDIADVLSLLESSTPGSRVSGLEVFFFNEQWDYSAPTVIPSFTVPSITGLVIDQVSQNLTWGLASGIPDGHRVETMDVNTGVLYSKYTVDHPNNPQLLKQATIPSADWLSPRVIKVTPFDALGDGIPSVIVWGGSSGVPPAGGGAGGTGSSVIHQTVNQTIQPNQVLCRVVFDRTVTFAINMFPSQAWIDVSPSASGGSVPPTASGDMIFSVQQFSYSNGSQDVGIEVACLHFVHGTHVGFYVAPNTTIFQPGDCLKVIAQNTPGDGVGIGLTLVGT